MSSSSNSSLAASSSAASSPSTNPAFAAVAAEPLVANPTTDDALSLFLVQIVIILVLVRILAKLLGKLRQPPVCGEIIAGILLGPSAFGYIPGFSSTIFPTSSLVIITVFAQIGLIFFMFFLGLEVDVLLLTRNWRAAAPIAIASIICPFGAGIGISFWFYGIEPTNATQTTFLLFMGTAFAFTAFPVLARILTSFRLLESGVGVHALSIAAIDDVLAWCVLAITLSYAGGGSALNGLYTMLLVVAFVLVVVFVARPFMVWAGLFFHTRKHSGDEFNRDYVAILFFLLACASIWTEIIGVHAFFGAFAFGVCVPKEHGLVEYLAPKIELLIVEFFLPLYFANSGLSTQLGSLDTGDLWGKAIALIVIATVAKMGPVTLMTRLTSTYFFVNTEDPDELEPVGGMDAEARMAKDAEMEERGEEGVMEVGEELEMVDIINKQHAEMADMGGVGVGGGGGAGKGTLGVIVDDDDDDGVDEDGQREKTGGNGEEEEKRMQETRRSAPPSLFVNTNPSDVIVVDGGGDGTGPSSLPSNEHKEAIDADITGDDDDLRKGEEREGSQLSRRSRRADGSGVHFQDILPSSSSSSAEHSLGKVIAHPTLSGTSSGRNSPTSRLSPSPSPNTSSPTPVPIPWITCLSIGVLMNTRGLVALIALNIGLQKGILGPKVFALMVLMALVTTFITSPVFEWIFYKPYMAAKRARREERRREAQAQRRLESGREGAMTPEDDEESELQRTARLKKEEQEEEKARDEELNRMTIMVHSTTTPRSQQTQHFSYFPQTPRSPPTGTVDERPDFRRAHTIGAMPSGTRGSLSGKMAVPLHSLYYPHDAEHHAYTRTAAGDHSFHLPPQPSGLRSVSSTTALDRLGRGGGARDNRSMHNLMQTGPSRMGLLASAGAPFRPHIASRHPSDPAHAGVLQTGPSRFHAFTPAPPFAAQHGEGGGESVSPRFLHTVRGGSPVDVVREEGGNGVGGEGRQLQSQLLQTGPSRVHMTGDIHERRAALGQAALISSSTP